uniref:mRNA cap guanine-N(7) methyltransferase n=1 Tax=Clastoptera arizonana TaxID=38151 RepID=A0A1B6DGR4_9HEMI
MTDSIQAIDESGLNSSEKAKKEDSFNECENSNDLERNEGHGAIVAAHYNTLEERGFDERNKSRIVHLRNFNNWIKSILIGKYLNKVKEDQNYGYNVKVLDMCCGKGGDLFKWRRGHIKYLICADIAATSVEQCQARYNEQNNKFKDKVFEAEFITADCTKSRLREQYKDPSIQVNLVNCQFAFHYSFESLAQAEQMLINASECLKPGGYFIGTIPNANAIVGKLKSSGDGSFGNDVFNIKFDENTKEPYPLFGAKYNFHLEGVVDCPEFLVHFPTLERLALKYGLKLEMKEKFQDFFDQNKNTGNFLLSKMQALETYPPNEQNILHGKYEEYKEAEEFIKKQGARNVGTLSQSEWDAASLYLVFAFRKLKPKSWDEKGKPIFQLDTTNRPE